MLNGYNFYFQVDKDTLLTFPITPEKLTMKVGSTNKVITLVNQGEANVLRPPGLAEFEFEARFPMRKYPYAQPLSPHYENFVSLYRHFYLIFNRLKEKKQTFRFIVGRHFKHNDLTWSTNELVTLEDFEIKENAENGDDVIISIKLKEYVAYEITKQVVKQNNTVKKEPAKPNNTNTKKEFPPYTVKKGDCLWNIAVKHYGNKNALKWKDIYKANKTVIEKTAKKYGYKSSNNGWWIFPGTKLTIPPL